MSSMNYDFTVRNLIKAKSNKEIDAILRSMDETDCKVIIRNLLGRYNTLAMQGAIEVAIAKKSGKVEE